MGLTFLRHTTPDVAKGVCYGMTDLGLVAGFQEEFSAALIDLPEVRQIVSSPLKRCRQLADFVATQFGLQVSVLDGLREMDFGCWEMVPWDDIARSELDEWAADFMDARPHGGESVQQLKDRVAETLHSLRDCLVVTHSGVIRAAAAINGHPEGWEIDVKYGKSVTL